MFALFSDNVRALGNTARPSGSFKWAVRLAHWLNRNDRRGAARNITAHYDLGNDFYRAWLDPSMTYSSAVDLSDNDLSAGQQRKLRSIATRLGDAERVLEIGCGWGSLAQLLAQRGSEVTAISLSEEQLIWARHNCLPEINFCQADYRDITGVYDAVACVEMVEALGRENWNGFLQCVNRRLRPGGRAALQYISMADDLFETYAGTVDFIQACIFPGGLLIKSSEFRKLAERRGFAWRDHASFGHDYAETLRIWRQRFSKACSEDLLPSGFDERFVALWDYYLTYCEGGFRAGNINVHQVTLVKT
ncbi:MAG: cyclopropane-fatty-acyl-phospholipid synthase family protein [Pseudomonadota bacterium]